MDRNQVTGLILISLMLILYFQFFAPTPQPQEIPTEQPQAQTELPRTELAPTQVPQMAELKPDTAQSEALQGKYGIFYPGAKGNSEITEIENDDFKVSFNSKGGIVSSV